MLEVVVSLALANICFDGQCHPALIGRDTPTGEYAVRKFMVPDNKLYQDGLLVFHETTDAYYAIHKTIPTKDRLRRMKEPPTSRVNVTGGCINIDASTYQALSERYKDIKLVIK